MIWVLVGVAIVALGLVLFVLSRRRPADGVTTFQRQIDALSPEARRPVVDRVQQLEADDGSAVTDGDVDEGDPDDDGPSPRGDEGMR